MKQLFIKYKNWIIIIIILLTALFGFLGCSDDDDLYCNKQKADLYNEYSERIGDLRANGQHTQADLLIEELSIAMENFVCE